MLVGDNTITVRKNLLSINYIDAYFSLPRPLGRGCKSSLIYKLGL